MAWDSDAENMAVNVIAKVEGSGAWDAINYNDPITLGLMQWFGTRAANLLNLIKADHPDAYAGIAASVRNDVDTYSKDSRWWTARWLTRAEGASIKPALRASKDTQGNLVKSDVIDYKKVAERIGLNPDTNTNTVIFWMCMYHQTPARANNLMKNIGMGSSLERTYRACINERVFSRYKSRYTQAYTYIKSGVAPQIIDLEDDDAEGGDDPTGGGTEMDGNGQESIFDQVRSNIRYIQVSGDELLVKLADNTTAFATPTGTNLFHINAKLQGEKVPDATPEPEESDDTPVTDPDPGGPASETQRKLVKFMTDRVGKYAYSQGASRLTPDKYNMTDCSGLTRYAYLSVTGKDIGTYTDAQVTNTNTRLIQKGGGGTSPTESLMELGDLVITARHGTPAGRIASHVEIYMGNGKIIGHGGPMKGPIIKDLAARTKDKRNWWVKRLKGL